VERYNPRESGMPSTSVKKSGAGSIAITSQLSCVSQVLWRLRCPRGQRSPSHGFIEKRTSCCYMHWWSFDLQCFPLWRAPSGGETLQLDESTLREVVTRSLDKTFCENYFCPESLSPRRCGARALQRRFARRKQAFNPREAPLECVCSAPPFGIGTKGTFHTSFILHHL